MTEQRATDRPGLLSLTQISWLSKWGKQIKQTIKSSYLILLTLRELYKHGHSLLVYFSHDLGTIHTMWLFLH